MITARTQVKEILKEQSINNVSSDFMERLDQKAKEIIIAAAKRARENGRRTVMGRDV